MFLSARNEQEEQEEKREIKRRLTRKVRWCSVPPEPGQGKVGHPPLLRPLLVAQLPGPLEATLVVPVLECQSVQLSRLHRTSPGDSVPLSFMTFSPFDW